MQFSLWIFALICWASIRDGATYTIDLDPYDEIACSADTRPRILEASPPGLITTPNFNISAELLYPPNALCEWQITQNGPDTMEFKFINFTLESSESCKNDYVEIYDDSADGDLVGRFCGQEKPDTIVRESGDVLFVRFGSDDTVEYPGFLARFGIPTLGVACESGRPQIMSGDNGTVSTENWPADYANGARCEWKFEADFGNVWVLNTTYFNTEDCCTCDEMQVFDGDSISAPRFGAWTGSSTRPPRIISSGRDMYLRFATDGSVVSTGFFSVYSQVSASEAEAMRMEW